jgi:hypothetical protein
VIHIDDIDKFGTFIRTEQDNIVLDRDIMKLRNLNEHGLTKSEKDIATQLITDGYYGTFDELLETVRRLAE